jgi:hypothetical protein
LIRVCVKGIISFIETNHPQITMWLGLKEKNLSIGIGNLSDFLKYFASGVLGEGLIDRTAILKLIYKEKLKNNLRAALITVNGMHKTINLIN